MKSFKNCCISSAVDGTDVDMLWIGSEEDRNVRSECEEDEGTDCEDMTLISKGIKYPTCFVYQVIIVKYFS